MTLYGQGGAGKTTLAADLAKLGATLHVDAEGGVEAISHRDDLDFVELLSWKQFEILSKELQQGKHGYKNIIIDNLSELVTMCITQIAGPTDSPEIQEYGEMTRKINHHVRLYRDMARIQGINVIFIAWDADEKDDRGVLKKDLALTPSLRKTVPGVINVIGHVAVLDDPTKRMLNFAPGPRTVSKFRRAGNAQANEVPFQIVYDKDNLPLADVIKTVKGEQKWPATKYPAVQGNRVR